LVAGFFRIFGSSYGFWSGSFFEDKFPDYTKEFCLIYAVGGIIGSLIAELIGGILGDSLESRCGAIKGLLSGLGTLLALAPLLYCFLFATSFYPSAFTLIANNFLGVWYGPSFTMINRILPPDLQGLGVGVWSLVGALGTATGTLLTGAMSDHFGKDRLGEILGIMIGVCYCISGPSFIIAGIIYSRRYARRD
jgi:predicted MFS family arabinose efflux permease